MSPGDMAPLLLALAALLTALLSGYLNRHHGQRERAEEKKLIAEERLIKAHTEASWEETANQCKKWLEELSSEVSRLRTDLAMKTVEIMHLQVAQKGLTDENNRLTQEIAALRASIGRTGR